MDITLAGGWEIFAAFIVLFTLAVVYSTYTRAGSAINQRAYHKIHGGAPGAFTDSDLAHDRVAARYSSRGTR